MNPFLRFLLKQPDPNLAAQVEIYTWQTCPYCIRAKTLLRWKGVAFTEYRIDGDGGARVRMAQRSGGARTLPQIFINQQHIGGCNDLYARDSQGQLDSLLREPPLVNRQPL
jgi:glutaredoxin 3